MRDSFTGVEIEDGGPAFREPGAWRSDGEYLPGDSGMSLRDYFAAVALQGYLAACANPGGILQTAKTAAENGVGFNDQLANDAYSRADAMLQARKKSHL